MSRLQHITREARRLAARVLVLEDRRHAGDREALKELYECREQMALLNAEAQLLRSQSVHPATTGFSPAVLQR